MLFCNFIAKIPHYRARHVMQISPVNYIISYCYYENPGLVREGWPILTDEIIYGFGLWERSKVVFVAWWSLFTCGLYSEVIDIAFLDGRILNVFL